MAIATVFIIQTPRVPLLAERFACIQRIYTVDSFPPFSLSTACWCKGNNTTFANNIQFCVLFIPVFFALVCYVRCVFHSVFHFVIRHSQVRRMVCEWYTHLLLATCNKFVFVIFFLFQIVYFIHAATLIFQSCWMFRTHRILMFWKR